MILLRPACMAQGACRSNLTESATQALVQRLKLRYAILLYHDYPLPALLCDLGEDWRAHRSWAAPGRYWASRMKKECCAAPCGTIFAKL